MPILELLYLFSAALLAAYGFNSLVLALLYGREDNKRPAADHRASGPADSEMDPGPTPGDAGRDMTSRLDYPEVTVQLPIYNERHVAERLIEAATKLHWPADRLQIQILDDSTDDTTSIIAAAVARRRAGGARMDIDHLRRIDRTGYKAGALQHGLASATGQFIAIFDADFVPPPDFLLKTVPRFNNDRIGCVQTRWGHINPATSNLTQVQALGIDGHFTVEQKARHAINAFLNFNGTAGVWRRACMLEAGGWQGDTLTEDLDLSYRAQLYGWQIDYEPDLIVPAELPVQINALKRQQFRWAKGSIQTALKLLGRLWRAPQPHWRKLLGTLHLTNYLVHPMMLLNLLLTLPMTRSESLLLRVTPLLMLSAIGPPLLYWTAMQARSISIPSRLGRLGLLMALGTGLSLNNTWAVLEAVFKISSEFKRTPKFAVIGQSRAWQTSAYILPRNPAVWLELLLAAYSASLLGFTLLTGIWWLSPWLLLYAAGYSYVSSQAFIQAWQTRAARLETAGVS